MELNVMAGYALAGLEVDARGRLVDDRVNLNSPLLNGTATLTDFVRSLSGMDTVTHTGADLSPDEPSRSVVHSQPGGVPGVLVVRPVWLTSWHRTGDPLDLAAQPPGPPTARLDPLADGMWPYAGQFMDAATGADLGEKGAAFHRAAQSLPKSGMDTGQLDHLARAMVGIDTFAAAAARVVPAVPSAVRALVAWGELFTDPATVNELRPALYTYWT